MRWIKLPAWILATIFPGTGGRDGDSSIGVACSKGSGAVSDGTGAESSGMVKSLAIAGGVSVEATDDISDGGGSVPSESAEQK